MNKLILLIGVSMLFTSCGKDDRDCNCSQQRWERKATYTVASSNNQSTLVSNTEWQKSGNAEPINDDDCNKNGTNAGNGSQNATLDPVNNTYTVTEYENRITCQ